MALKHRSVNNCLQWPTKRYKFIERAHVARSCLCQGLTFGKNAISVHLDSVDYLIIVLRVCAVCIGQ